MAFNFERLTDLAKSPSRISEERTKARKKNREWIRMSQDIALSLHYYMRKNGLTQKELAGKLGVSPVYVGRLLKGGENLTLETICNIQSAIGEKLISLTRPYTILVATLSCTHPVQKRLPSYSFNGNKYINHVASDSAFVSAPSGAA